jgi:hypothetical protein
MARIARDVAAELRIVAGQCDRRRPLRPAKQPECMLGRKLAALLG